MWVHAKAPWCAGSMLVAVFAEVERRTPQVGHPHVPLYTPDTHPLRPSRELQTQLERIRLGLTSNEERNLTFRDLYLRYAPVESSFFSTFARDSLSVDCTAPGVTQRIPPIDSTCDHEPKFSCGKIGKRRSGRRARQGAPLAAPKPTPACHVWSIGSAGETCFEEYVAKQVKHRLPKDICHSHLLHAPCCLAISLHLTSAISTRNPCCTLTA